MHSVHRMIHHDSHRLWGISQTIKLPSEMKRNHIYHGTNGVCEYFKTRSTLAE